MNTKTTLRSTLKFARFAAAILPLACWGCGAEAWDDAAQEEEELADLEQPLTTGRLLAVAQSQGRFQAIGGITGCSGTLISHEAVLTAAHCFCPNDDSAIGCTTRTTFTLVGVQPVDDPSTPANESLGAPTNIRIGGDVVVYPNFGALGWLRQDYAIVMLDEPVYDRAIGVVPQPVADASRAPSVGDRLMIAGYGLSRRDCSGGSLGQIADVTPSEVVPDAIRFDAPGAAACPGDSGGPAIDRDQFVLGVASWGNGILSTYRPAYEVESWIRGVIDPLETESDVARFNVSQGDTSNLGRYNPHYADYRPAVGIVGQAVSPADGFVYTWYRNGTYGRGRSGDLGGNLRQASFEVPAGYRPDDIVGMGFTSTDRVYTWYRNGQVSVGSAIDLDSITAPYAYSAGAGRRTRDIVAIDISLDDYVYTWFRDGTRAIGRSWDLSVFGSSSYSLPSGKTPDDIVEIAIGRSRDNAERVYTWYQPR